MTSYSSPSMQILQTWYNNITTILIPSIFTSTSILLFQEFLSYCRNSYYLKIKKVTLTFLVQSEWYIQQYKVGRKSWIMFRNWQEEIWWMSKIPFYNTFSSSISRIILSYPQNWEGCDLLILRLRKGPFSFPMSKRWINFKLTRIRKYKNSNE